MKSETENTLYYSENKLPANETSGGKCHYMYIFKSFKLQFI